MTPHSEQIAYLVMHTAIDRLKARGEQADHAAFMAECQAVSDSIPGGDKWGKS